MERRGVRVRPALAWLWLALATALFSIAPDAGYPVEPNEMLADPALEARAREISRGLRCLVCQNESIDESHAELARDLRLLVRERLAGGDSDEQVVQFIVDRYGDFVLLRPPLKPATYPLWAAPVILLGIAAAILVTYLRRHRRNAPPPQLTGEERARVDELLKVDREP